MDSKTTPAPAAPANEQKARDNADAQWPQDKFHRAKRREYGAVIGDPPVAKEESKA